MPDLSLLVNLLQLAVKDRTQLVLENIALRHQLAVYRRNVIGHVRFLGQHARRPH